MAYWFGRFHVVLTKVQPVLPSPLPYPSKNRPQRPLVLVAWLFRATVRSWQADFECTKAFSRRWRISLSPSRLRDSTSLCLLEDRPCSDRQYASSIARSSCPQGFAAEAACTLAAKTALVTCCAIFKGRASATLRTTRSTTRRQQIMFHLGIKEKGRFCSFCSFLNLKKKTKKKDSLWAHSRLCSLNRKHGST